MEFGDIRVSIKCVKLSPSDPFKFTVGQFFKSLSPVLSDS